MVINCVFCLLPDVLILLAIINQCSKILKSASGSKARSTEKNMLKREKLLVGNFLKSRPNLEEFYNAFVKNKYQYKVDQVCYSLKPHNIKFISGTSITKFPVFK